MGGFALAIAGSMSQTASASPPPPDSGSGPSDEVSRAAPLAGDTDVNISGGENWVQSGITTDPQTWPAGDAVWDICRAIAIAEGYNTNGAAFKLNNPGDISDGGSQFGAEAHDGSNVTHFPDAATGWNWLYNKISNHLAGKSSTYPQTMTITQFAQKYAGNWQNWKNNVGRALDVDPDTTTFAQYVG